MCPLYKSRCVHFGFALCPDFLTVPPSPNPTELEAEDLSVQLTGCLPLSLSLGEPLNLLDLFLSDTVHFK